MKLTCEPDGESLQEAVNLAAGLYSPLNGFMDRRQNRTVVDGMQLPDGRVWSLPITLAVDEATWRHAHHGGRLTLTQAGQGVAEVEVTDCWEADTERNAAAVFGTVDCEHPGVRRELTRSRFRVGGPVKVTDSSLLANTLRPENTRRVFHDHGWRTVAAFHTRNPVHRAHEHLQRVGLEVCDGLFINPALGWKKPGDFSDEAIMRAYEVMLRLYYPRGRVYLAGLPTAMRYAGPREAVFHALVRRNLGCTHIIIGRDHAGVGAFYGRYEAQELAARLNREKGLGIELLLLSEPYYCRKCDEIVSEKHCGHGGDDVVPISGSYIRTALREGKRPDGCFLRPEVADALISLGKSAFIP